MQSNAIDFSDALSGVDQAMLDGVSELGEMRKMESAAFLKIGALHGVTVEVEAPLGADGNVPFLIRQGLVVRCLLPRGISLARLADALAEGPAARLVQKVLEGHRLHLTVEGGTGNLTRAAELARGRLLETLSGMAPVAVSAAPRPWKRPSTIRLAA